MDSNNDYFKKGRVSDQKATTPSEEKLREQLFQKFSNPAKVIDEYEKATGLKVPKAPVRKFKVKNKVFDFDNDIDQELLQELLNNQDKYELIFRDQNWDKMGRYKWAVIYKVYEDQAPTTNIENPDATPTEPKREISIR